MRVAGDRQRATETVLHVDYGDLIREAVEVEHWKTLRAVIEVIESAKTTKPHRPGDYREEDRRGADVKADILASIKAMAR